MHSAEEALRSGDRVALEPMSSGDRRLVHERLKAYGGVETSSEGDEPNRYVVVFPGFWLLYLSNGGQILIPGSLVTPELDALIRAKAQQVMAPVHQR